MSWYKKKRTYVSAGTQELVDMSTYEESRQQALKSAVKSYIFQNSGLLNTGQHTSLSEYLIQARNSSGMYDTWEAAYRFSRSAQYNIISYPNDVTNTYRGDYYPMIHFIESQVDVLDSQGDSKHAKAAPQIVSINKELGNDATEIRDQFKQSVGDEWGNMRLFTYHLGVGIASTGTTENSTSKGEVAYLFSYLQYFKQRGINTSTEHTDLHREMGLPPTDYIYNHIVDNWANCKNIIGGLIFHYDIQDLNSIVPAYLRRGDLNIGDYQILYDEQDLSREPTDTTGRTPVRRYSELINTGFYYTITYRNSNYDPQKPYVNPYRFPETKYEAAHISVGYSEFHIIKYIYIIHRKRSGLFDVIRIVHTMLKFQKVESYVPTPKIAPFIFDATTDYMDRAYAAERVGIDSIKNYTYGYSDWDNSGNWVTPLHLSGFSQSESTNYPVVPVDRNLLSGFSTKERDRVITAATRASWVHSKTVEEYRSWVKPFLQIGAFVLAVTLTVKSFGTGAKLGASLLKAATSLVVGVAIDKIIDFAVKVGIISPKIASIIKLAVQLTMIAKGAGWDFSKTLTAPNIMKAVNLSFDYYNKKKAWEMQEVQKQQDEHNRMHQSRMEALAEKQKMADLGVASDPSLYLDMPSFAPSVNLFETPEMMYARHYNFNVVNVSHGLISNLADGLKYHQVDRVQQVRDITQEIEDVLLIT